MRQRFYKFIIILVCFVIVLVPVNCFAAESPVFSSTDITSFISSDSFVYTSSPNIIVKSFLYTPCYSLTFPKNISSLIVPFDLNLDFFVSKYKSYNLNFPFVFLTYTSKNISDLNKFNIYFNILYSDGSVSSFSVSPISITKADKKQPLDLFYVDFDFNITGNKLLNIDSSYFEIVSNSSTSSRTFYFGIDKNSSVNVYNFSPSYSDFFNFSINSVSDVFNFVIDSPALILFCVGMPIVLFAFILFKRLKE